MVHVPGGTVTLRGLGVNVIVAPYCIDLLDHQRAAIGDREDEVALTILAKRRAHLHGVPGDPAIGKAGLQGLPETLLGRARRRPRFVTRVEADDGHGLRFYLGVPAVSTRFAS